MARHRKHVRRAPRSNPRGVLVARAGGFGFVSTAEGEFFVPASAMGGAFDGDLVELAPISRRGERGGASGRGGGRRDQDKPAARVVRVLDRAHDTVIGRYEVAEPFGVVVPEDTRISYDIFTLRADHPEVPDGALVCVRVTQFPTRHTAATGVVEEVIGTAEAAALGVDVIVARHKLETEFSAAALEEARVAVLDEEGALAAGYRDLRDRVTFTIDPADARDFDDALSLDWVPADGTSRPRPGGKPDAGAAGEACGLWRLGVHIADVSHYVEWNSSLDLDARRRATSVYLVDRVIPMLPEELSNELCSLKPGEARRSMTVDLYLDDAGDLVRFEAYPALIRSDARLTYDEALAMIEPGGRRRLPRRRREPRRRLRRMPRRQVRPALRRLRTPCLTAGLALARACRLPMPPLPSHPASSRQRGSRACGRAFARGPARLTSTPSRPRSSWMRRARLSASACVPRRLPPSSWSRR